MMKHVRSSRNTRDAMSNQNRSSWSTKVVMAVAVMVAEVMAPAVASSTALELYVNTCGTFQCRGFPRVMPAPVSTGLS